MRECLGESLLAVGQVKAAREQLERSVAAIDKGEGPHWSANARFLLARALWATPADRPRALQIARAIRRDLAAAQGSHRKLLARIDAWLAARGHGADGRRGPADPARHR